MRSSRSVVLSLMAGVSACGPVGSKDKCNAQSDCLSGFVCSNGTCGMSASTGGSADGMTFLTDGGSSATLNGDTSFTPVGVVTGRIGPEVLSVVIHDYVPAGSSCTSTIPNGATANALRLRLYKSDGGVLSTGTYAVAGPGTPGAGPTASLTNDSLRPTGLTTVSVGISGTATVALLTTTRIAGSFDSTVYYAADGGLGTLRGTFDTNVCP